MRLPFGRRRSRWDAQPTDSAGVVLASDGTRDFSSVAVARAIEVAREGGAKAVAVVTIAKVHGTGFGLPHPGLMPTKKELTERAEWVNAAARDIKRAGLDADGQVASTRNPAKVIARVAAVRGASVIVLDRPPAAGWRRAIEGDLGKALSRRSRGTVAVVTVPD